MTKKSRRIIFYIFVVAFIIIVPIIILYALGFSFDIANKTMISTGGIYLKSIPSDAEIYIDDKLAGSTTKLVKRLLPKIYEVSITKEGYYPWQKNLTVEPQMVAKAQNVLLVPSSPKISLLPTESAEFEQINNPYLYPVKDILDIIRKKSSNKISTVTNFDFDARGQKLYFTSNNNLYYLKIDAENINNSVLSESLLPTVLNFAIYRDGIMYLDSITEKIYELDLTTLKSANVFEQVFPSFKQGKWTISDDNKKLLCQKDTSVEILWLDDVTTNSIFRKKGDMDKIDFGQKINDVIWYPRTDEHLIVASDNSIIITELDNRTPRNTYNFISTDKPQILYDSSQKLLLFLSQNKLYQTEL